MTTHNQEELIEGRDYYIEHGLFIFTGHYLTHRGYCCKNGCRHCPYLNKTNMLKLADIEISKDKSKLNIDLIHKYLSTSYWAQGRTITQVKQSIDHSYCYGVYLNGDQIGLARVVSDLTIFAYIMDVFIIEEHQGMKYGYDLMKNILDDIAFKAVKNWYLITKDAQSFYAQFGFADFDQPDKSVMVLRK